MSTSRPVNRSGIPSPSGSTPTSAFAWVGSAHTSTPKILAVPASGRSSPTAIDNDVVFPAPFGPSIPKNDPFGTARLRSSTAFSSPKTFVNPTNSNACSITARFLPVPPSGCPTFSPPNPGGGRHIRRPTRPLIRPSDSRAAAADWSQRCAVGGVGVGDG